MSRFGTELASASRPVPRGTLAAQGVSARSLASASWRRTSHGRYVPSAAAATTPAQRIVEAAALIPDAGTIGGWAAAYAFGTGFLDGLDGHTMKPLPVTAYLPGNQRRRDVPGVEYVRGSLAAAERISMRGIWFTHRVRTALDLACRAPDLTEAVVALDAVIAAQLTSRTRLIRELDGLAGRRGAVQARRAIDLCRPGVRSPWESRLRMFWVLDLGLPTPLVNPSVYDPGHYLLGQPDLLDEDAGLAMEYDGVRWDVVGLEAGHRDRRQHRDDNLREETFERANLVVARVDKVDLTRERAKLGAASSPRGLTGWPAIAVAILGPSLHPRTCSGKAPRTASAASGRKCHAGNP